MSDTQIQFTFTTTANTDPSAPQVNQCQLGMCRVDKIRWRVPPGWNGQAGFYIASSLQQIIPFRSGVAPNWIVPNDEWDIVELDGLPTSGDYQVVTYNLGSNPHTIYVTFHTSVNNLTADLAGTLSGIGAAVANLTAPAS